MYKLDQTDTTYHLLKSIKFEGLIIPPSWFKYFRKVRQNDDIPDMAKMLVMSYITNIFTTSNVVNPDSGIMKSYKGSSSPTINITTVANAFGFPRNVVERVLTELIDGKVISLDSDVLGKGSIGVNINVPLLLKITFDDDFVEKSFKASTVKQKKFVTEDGESMPRKIYEHLISLKDNKVPSASVQMGMAKNLLKKYSYEDIIGCASYLEDCTYRHDNNRDVHMAWVTSYIPYWVKEGRPEKDIPKNKVRDNTAIESMFDNLTIVT